MFMMIVEIYIYRYIDIIFSEGRVPRVGRIGKPIGFAKYCEVGEEILKLSALPPSICGVLPGFYRADLGA